MRQALDTIAGLLTGNADALACNWGAVRFQHTAAIRSKLAEVYAASTANKFLSALRGTLKAAWQLGQMSAEDYHKAASVGGVKGETVPAGRELSGGELSALMQACAQDHSPAGARDAAIIALLYACGLRRAEVVALDLADYDPDAGRVVVQGKRNKQRYAYPVNGAGRAMADWLNTRGDEPGALFRAINKGGRIRKGKITPQAIYNMLQKRAGEAGVKEFSPHDLRRTFVSDLLDAGADIVTVSKMAGHASVQTTARYDRRPEEAKRKAAGLLHVPYQSNNRDKPSDRIIDQSNRKTKKR
jgi:site-specific recombinase XerD